MLRVLVFGVAVASALTVAGCGSSGTRARMNSTTTRLANQDLAYARCMRANLVTDFPDPNHSGAFPKSQLARLAGSNPQFRGAHSACRHLLLNQVETGPAPTQVQQELSGMVRFAACISSDGVRSWPDPTVDRSYPSDPRPVFELLNHVDANAPRIKAAIHTCRHVMPRSEMPYMCAQALAPAGSQPGNEGCTGWLPPPA
jgi:hypothetical protein